MTNNKLNGDFIETLKSKCDIVSIIGDRLRLEKKGKNFWACCPFHHEKTPSFCINEYQQFYHCFGCGESGDVISFLRKYENWEYMETIKYLADKVGLEVPTINYDDNYSKLKKERDKSLEILNFAKEIYKQNIYKPDAVLAQKYIKSRNVGKKELENFELGYSSDAFSIVNILQKKGYSNQELKNSGLCEISKSGKAYDFLANRLIFPIVNSFGDCVGFSGRDLSGDSQAKYKNSPATSVFDKSKCVYAINLIKNLKQNETLQNIIIVEGQFDVISMHHSGFTNTVACMGTAFTKEHIRELKRYCDKIILCLDGDSAGQKATLRTLGVLEGSDLDVKVCVLPNGKDPDEFLKTEGAEKLKKLLANAIAPMEFKILTIKNKYNLTKNEELAKFVKEAIKEISTLTLNSEREIYLAELKNLTGISIDILRRDLMSANTSTTKAPPIQPILQDATTKAVEYVLASMLFDKPYVNHKINLDKYILNPSLKKLYELIIQKNKENKKLIASALFDLFDIDEEKCIKDVMNVNFEIIENEEKFYNSCLWQIIESDLKFRKNELSKQYSEEKNIDVKRKLLIEIANIDLQLKNKNLGDF